MQELKILLNQKAKLVDGYKVVEFGHKEKALLLEGEHYKIIPITTDLRKIYLEVTTKCNFDCITCIRNSWNENLGHMDMTIFNKLLMSLSELEELETVHLGGFGEPLSHPKILTIIEQLKRRNIRVELITNGALLSHEMNRELIGLGVDYIYVSIDSSIARDYSIIRRGGDLNQVIQNILGLNELRTNKSPYFPKLGIAFVAMKSNLSNLSNLMKLANRLKADRVSISNVLPYNKELVDETLYDMEDAQFPFSIDVVHATIANMKLRSYRRCKFIEQKSVSVNWQGDVVPCYSLLHSYKCYIYGREKQISKSSFGNIIDRSLKEIWNEPKFVNFRYRVKDNQFPSCTDCKWLEGCSYTDDNQADCWGNEPSCADCLWYKEIIICP